jgi:hypothetical protein
VSAERDVGKNDEERDAEKQVTSMRDQLRNEIASWSEGRKQQSSENVVAAPRPVIQRRSPRPAGESKKSAVPSPAGKPLGVRSKPFGMSYDGMTQAEYTQYLLDRGSR